MPLELNDHQRKAMTTLRKQHPHIGKWLAQLSREVSGDMLEDADMVTEVLLMKSAAFDEYGAPAADALIADLLQLDRIGALEHGRAQQFTMDLEALLQQ
ncbi:MAG TPA: hypothetical protein VJS90_06035 [Pseudomonas sp.]|uniref:hypothetical protein n=1 Tax=Pseudomonas sp. TaxID=306 RepID=UPI002B4649C0|nr:hypothetical protein [Pseudomonas sp.]HKS12582.1 hypothetical protein [Pseudomonas sp.]